MQIEVDKTDLLRLFNEHFMPSILTDSGKELMKKLMYGPVRLIVHEPVESGYFIWHRSELRKLSETEIWDLYQKVKSTHI